MSGACGAAGDSAALGDAPVIAQIAIVGTSQAQRLRQRPVAARGTAFRKHSFMASNGTFAPRPVRRPTDDENERTPASTAGWFEGNRPRKRFECSCARNSHHSTWFHACVKLLAKWAIVGHPTTFIQVFADSTTNYPTTAPPTSRGELRRLPRPRN